MGGADSGQTREVRTREDKSWLTGRLAGGHARIIGLKAFAVIANDEGTTEQIHSPLACLRLAVPGRVTLDLIC